MLDALTIVLDAGLPKLGSATLGLLALLPTADVLGLVKLDAVPVTLSLGAVCNEELALEDTLSAWVRSIVSAMVSSPISI
jgi:hypothetical protein